MAMIDPAEGKKFERDPEEGNFPTGVYVCELTRVQEISPSPKFPEGNPRLVFEFTVVGGQYGGKKTVAFLGKTLHKSKDGKESNLVKWARMMGVVNPEKGFDPDTLLGKRYQVMCEYEPPRNPGETGRAWARTAIVFTGPAPDAATAPAAGGLGADGMPVTPPTPDPSARWDYSDGISTPVLNATTAELQHFFATANVEPTKIRVKPAGAPREQAKTAAELGFGVQKPDVIPW